MTMYRLFSLALAAVLAASLCICRLEASPPGDDGKLRIIVFGAHPDDAEFDAGGTAALWSSMGHHVKFVSVTNGDLGHYEQGGGPLAQRRKAEVLEAAKSLGITTEVLDIHDGELMPTLENRKRLVRLIRLLSIHQIKIWLRWRAAIQLLLPLQNLHPAHHRQP